MRSNRHVPFIMGILTTALAVWLTLHFSGWWRFIPSTFLFAFGWVSLKTAFFASEKEIEELTNLEPMSEETSKKLKDRL